MINDENITSESENNDIEATAADESVKLEEITPDENPTALDNTTPKTDLDVIDQVHKTPILDYLSQDILNVKEYSF